MRNCCSSIDILSIIDENKEKYLYLTQEELFNKKLEEDKELLHLKASTNINNSNTIEFLTRPPKVRPKKSNYGGRYFYVKIQL